MELHTEKLSDGLLGQSIQQRLTFFKNDQFAILHRNLEQTINVLLKRICRRSQSELILVVGPSGVGKTILLRMLENEVIREVMSELLCDPGLIPFINVEAIAVGQGKFAWSNLYRQMLIALGELYIDQKIDYVVTQDLPKRRKPSSSKKATEITLFNSLLLALSYRKPYGLAIDEMQHIGRMASQIRLAEYGERIKSLMEGSQVSWLGFGTYQLLDLLNSELQMNENVKIIHFSRYHYELQQDIQEFQKILRTFQSRMPFSGDSLLFEEHWDFCYERSIGCVGILKDWLTQAVALALEEEAETLSINHLERTTKLPSECLQMLKDTTDGEGKVAEYLNEKPWLSPDYAQDEDDENKLK